MSFQAVEILGTDNDFFTKQISMMRLSVGLKKAGLSIPMCDLVRLSTLNEQLEYLCSK
jgi:hypothetical protein